jgi:hypothetical protein
MIAPPCNGVYVSFETVRVRLAELSLDDAHDRSPLMSSRM